MPSQKDRVASDNIIYLDFDGTLTGAPGREVIGTELCQKLKTANTTEERKKFKSHYNKSDDTIKITKEAKTFLNTMNQLHPRVQVVIISRNHENYIRGLLEFENIDTSNFTIYPRGEGKKLGLGEDKKKAVQTHEKNRKPGLRFICDDDKVDYGEMVSGTNLKENSVFGYSFAPGKFNWAQYTKEICSFLPNPSPVAEYLKGSKKNRFHLFSANVNSISSKSNNVELFKNLYKSVKGDDLKRSILNDLKLKLADIKTAEELTEFKKSYLQSPEYKLLSKGQGLTTRVFSLKTDSIKAVDLIFKDHENQINEKTTERNNIN